MNRDEALRELRDAAGVSELCVHCGRVATGFARIGVDRLCHGDDDPEPTCYMSTSWAWSFMGWPLDVEPD
jgi:hypothetical protein